MEHNNKFNKGFMFGVAAGALGALFLYKKRGRIRSSLWKLRARAELYRRLYELKRATRERFEDLVDEVLEEYGAWGTIAEEELEDFAEELKDTWRDVKHRFEDAVQTATRKAEEGKE